MNTLTTDFQIHHILPTEIFNDDFLSDKLESLLGKDSLQSYNNRIGLFEDSQMAEYYKNLKGGDGLWAEIPLGSVKHNGYHSGYNKVLTALIVNIIDNDSLNEVQKKVAIIDLQSTIKNGLMSGDLNLYGEKEDIRSYIDQHAITAQQLIDQGERYQKAYFMSDNMSIMILIILKSKMIEYL